jgi:Trp operon repressor
MFANIVFDKPLLQKKQTWKKTLKILQNQKKFEKFFKLISTLLTTSLMKQKSLK